jgi:hypothetical protein
MNKKYAILLSYMFLFAFTQAQTNLPALDKSPMDMSYYPNGYPVQKIQDKINEQLVARVIYGRPQKNNRVIFGDLIPYGNVWRLGANEATEIEFFKPVKIGNTKIKKGRYTLYAIPFADKWTIILNSESYTWGAFKYDIKKDIVRTNVPVLQQSETTEPLSMLFDKSSTGANLVIVWDTIKVTLPIIF